MFSINSKVWLYGKKIGWIVPFMAAIVLLPCSQALAHNVTVFAWVDGDIVHVESKYSGGRKPVEAPVEVYDTRGRLLLKGVTDDNGQFSFKVPQKTEMKVVLLAGMGHKGEWTILLSDLEGGSAETSPQTAEPGAATQDQAVIAAPDVSGNPVPAKYVSAAEFQNAVEEALDIKLKPVMKLLVETRQSGPSVTDILGGIGYIIGLVGVAAYFSAKRRKP
jgi:nickel transport protein